MCFPLFLSLWFAEHASALFCNTRWLLWNNTVCWCQELQPGQGQPEELHMAGMSVFLLEAGREPPWSHVQQQPAPSGAWRWEFLFLKSARHEMCKPQCSQNPL